MIAAIAMTAAAINSMQGAAAGGAAQLPPLAMDDRLGQLIDAAKAMAIQTVERVAGSDSASDAVGHSGKLGAFAAQTVSLDSKEDWHPTSSADAVSPSSVTVTVPALKGEVAGNATPADASSQTLVIPDGGTVELDSPFTGTISFAGSTGTLKIDDSASFGGTITGQLTKGNVIDLADITAGADASLSYSGNNSPGTVTVSDGTHTANIALDGIYSLANFTVSADGLGGTFLVDPPAAQTAFSLREIDGGINYFSQFSHSLSTDPGYFPIGVWFEGVSTQQDINLDKAAGLNTYVVITSGSDFSLIEQNGMYVIAQQSELRTNNTVISNSSTVGWELRDEIDMELGPSGYSTLNSIIASLPDDGRFTYNNFGKGVQLWQTDAEAARYVNSVDVASADIYWFTDPWMLGGDVSVSWLNNGQPLTDSQVRLAANYGYAIDHLRALDATDGVTHPIWGFVELGWPFTQTAAEGARAIRPDEVKAAVWQEIIAGARGVIYFNHSFGGPEQTQHVLRDPYYADIRAAVTETDALIKQLAPVLNSPFDDAFVTVNSSVRAMAKYYGGEHYVFAGSTQSAASTDTFKLAGITSGTAVVVGENRTISIVNGQFVDTFADGNAIHIYHIVAGSTSTAPGAPTIASFSDDSGVVGDNITNDTTLALAGTAVAGSTVKVFDGSTQVGTATANSSGDWTLTTTTLANGSHSLTATATTSAGTSSASTPLTVTIDTVAPPAPTIVASTSAANLASTHVEVLTGTAEANSKVAVFDGTTKLSTVTANSSGAWSYTTAPLSVGSHSFTANATDAAGNTGSASSAVVVTIATAPTTPAAPTIASFSTDSGLLGDNITNDNTLTLAGTAVAGSTVKVFQGSTQVGTATANSSGAWGLTTTTLADGSHALTATATNSGGTSSASTPLSVTIDTVAPSAPTIAASTSAATLETKIAASTSDATLESTDVKVLTGAAEANSTVTVFDGTAKIGTATADANGAWSYTTAPLSVGTHSLTAKATDAAGNTGAASSAAVVTIAAAPEAYVDFTDISQGCFGVTKIKGMAHAGSVVKLYDGSTSIGSATAGTDGSWTFTKWGLSNTVHTLTAQEVNSSGQVVSTSTGAAILGSTRSDTLTGTAGDDLFLSKGGQDTFVFAANFGHDVIKDFDAIGRSHDVVQFSKSVFDSFASVLDHASQVGRDVVISTGSDTLTLKNVKLSALDSHDFHFA